MSNDAPTLDRLTGKAALAALPSADRRSDQPNFASSLTGRDDDIDPLDTTTILHGAKAISGKGAGITVLQNAATFAQYDDAKKKLAERQAAEARELALLAAWGGQRTVIGGVAMTNAEAQDARQHVIDNGDRYAEWAVQQGHIREDEKEALIAAVRRQKELEDKRGRGTITPEEEREAEAFKRSRLSRAADATTAQAYRDQTVDLSATIRQENGNAAFRRSDAPIAVDTTIFQAYDATKPKPVTGQVPATAAAVSAMGLDL